MSCRGRLLTPRLDPYNAVASLADCSAPLFPAMTPATETEPPAGSAGPPPGPEPRREAEPVYSAAFWIAYAANTAVVTGNALTFRFAELVDFLGGHERTAGVIIGIATAAALLSRLYLGQALDRYGVRRLWVASSLLFVAGGALLTAADSLSALLLAARSLFAIGLAGMFTCSTVHIQNLVPPHRRTEVIGSLGSSGFVGMILGSLLGDMIFQTIDGRVRFTVLFGASTLLGALYVALVLIVTRRDRHEAPAKTPALHKLALHYWPGNVILVAFVMGTMLAVTTVFLTRFATHRGLSGLGPFFASYAGSAFTFRLVTRGWSRTVGRHRMILFGLAGHAVAMLLLPFVTNEWLFAVPAVFGGFGHALLFPAVVSLGSEAFPIQYRGTGTTLVMGFFDVGTFASAPVLGGIIDAFDGAGFTPMFLFAASTAVSVAFVYSVTTARTPDSDLAVNPFASEGLAAENLAREPTFAGPSARDRSASEIFGPEGSASQTFSRRGTCIEPSARGEQANQSSARDGILTLAPHPPGASDRGGVIPATRCR